MTRSGCDEYLFEVLPLMVKNFKYGLILKLNFIAQRGNVLPVYGRKTRSACRNVSDAVHVKRFCWTIDDAKTFH